MSCEENRCDMSQRSLYEDTQVFRGCVGDRIRFLPDELVISDRYAASGGAAATGGSMTTGEGGEAALGGLGGSAVPLVDPPGTGGSVAPLAGPSGTGGAIPAPASNASQAVQLIAEGTNGWRRDHAEVVLYLDWPACADQKAAPDPFPLQLLTNTGCTGAGNSLRCLTDANGTATFSVSPFEEASSLDSTLYVCPDWEILKSSNETGDNGKYDADEQKEHCLAVHLGRGSPVPLCPSSCGEGGEGGLGCADSSTAGGAQ